MISVIKKLSNKLLNNKKLLIIFFINIFILIFVYNNSFLYSKSIVKVTNEKTKYSHTDTNLMGYKEKYYTQSLKGTIINGAEKNKEIIMKNTYGKSLVYADSYSGGDLLFVENIKKSDDVFSGNISGKKRDFYWIFLLLLLIDLLILVGRKIGLFTIISLTINITIFISILYFYNRGLNLLSLIIPTIGILSSVVLLMISGKNKKTLTALVSTLVTVSLIGIISFILLKYSNNIDYEFMEYLREPYTQYDANIIFLSQLLIAGLGAIMDVAITISSASHELIVQNPGISAKNLLNACKEIGDDITGTMINVVFFTNVVSGLPFFVLSMRNGIKLGTVFHYNIFFELSRFLIGGIGILLCIPISTLLALMMFKGSFFNRRKEEC